MRTFKLQLILLFITAGFIQCTTSNKLQSKINLEKSKEIALLVESQEFKFVAQKAFPQGYNAIDLTTNYNFIEFSPNLIKSEMPFFGRGYSGIAYGGDQGLSFKGKPITYIIKKGNKKNELNANVRGDRDVFKIYLSILLNGSATLTIYSNNRSSISYFGTISKIENKKDY
ncbi:DUF4251 domain-containing protein [Flavobacterium sp. PL11]|jgi:hypothetical protein|uniref:DUF4251 domain-containing protein n=1 Tax=Flavobacterium sp. PL11 TaxID=3071717 RepID=UPI002E14E080